MDANKPRLLILCSAYDPDAFAQVARWAAEFAEHYDVRVDVSEMARKNPEAVKDPGDSYQEFSAYYPSLFDFSLHEKMAPFRDRGFVQSNVEAMETKVAVLQEVGLRPAFCGREPACVREDVFRRYPHWRGPRIDHPRRSRNPLFSLCLHQPEVQALYHETVEALTRRFGIDTFYWLTNDCAAGFCWYEGLYCGPNGPQACKAQGDLSAVNAFQEAVLGGSRAGGAEAPVSYIATGNPGPCDRERMPKGTYHWPDPRVATVQGLYFHTTDPVRYLWNPLDVVNSVRAARRHGAEIVTCPLPGLYRRGIMDLPSVRRVFDLWQRVLQTDAPLERLTDQLNFLADELAPEFGREAAALVAEACLQLRAVFNAMQYRPWKVWVDPLPFYGSISMRWLTRPLVAFPEEISAEDEALFLPHIFSSYDDAIKRTHLLDVLGWQMADPDGDYHQYSRYFERLDADLGTAQATLQQARQAAEGEAAEYLGRMVKALSYWRCLWKNCRLTIELAVLRAPCRRIEPAEMLCPRREQTRRLSRYQQEIYRVLREEVDNVNEMRRLLADDREGILVRAETADREDPFLLGPDLDRQLARKVEIMMEHWHRVVELVADRDDLNKQPYFAEAIPPPAPPRPRACGP